MQKINWKVRARNPLFLVQVICAVFLPVLAYMGIQVEDLTSWEKLWEVWLGAISNPYILGMMVVSAFNAMVDPTTKGICDSEQVLTYKEPKE